MRRWGVGGVGGAGGAGSGGGGILRKSSPGGSQRPQLLVFGYSCKLFRDDDRALHIDLGRHLIPCMGDDTLKVDRYDARATLGSRELAAAEGSGNFPRGWERLTAEEQRVEGLCDEERYRALYCDEDEEEMYREEELKRIHMSNSGRYGQVEFNYDVKEPESEMPQTESKNSEDPSKTEDDEPFIPPEHLVIPEGMAVPETQKLNTIIEKTASFIAGHGTQMEILLKAKQSKNPQFEFLSLTCPLYAYYSFILAAIKEGRHKIQEDPKEDKTEEDDNYLHPSLAPLSVESAPSIPSISYKPSADCAYSMLVNQIKGTNDEGTQPKNETEEENTMSSIDTELAPPGTEPFPIVANRKNDDASLSSDYSNIPPELMQMYAMHGYYNYLSVSNQAEISKAPVLYNRQTNEESQPIDTNIPQANDSSYPSVQSNTNQTVKTAKYLEDYDSGTNSPKPAPANSTVSIGLKLTHYYNSDSDNDSDSSAGSNNTRTSQSQLIEMPPPDQQVIIDKMASYVARNGNDFEQIVRMKGDPRFSFLDSSHKFNPYYNHKRSFYERINKPKDSKNSTKSESKSDRTKVVSEKKVMAPVSFSIKKMKEPETILPKPALPYESTSEEETENNCSDNQDSSSKDFPIEKFQPKVVEKPQEIVPKVEKVESKPEPYEPPKVEYKPKPFTQIYQIQPIVKEQPHSTTSTNNVSSAQSLKRKESDKNDISTKYSTSENLEHDDYIRKKKKKHSRSDRNEIPSDVITIDEEFDSRMNAEFIDLTGECNDDEALYLKDGMRGNTIQLERKKRAAAFLSSLKTVPAAPIEHHHTLASAMVKTLHSLQNQDEKSSPRRKRKRESPSKKSKKKKSNKIHSSDTYDSDDDHGDNSWRQSSRNSYKSRDHSHDRHSKKSKRKKSSRERSPDYYKSRSYKKSKTSSKDIQRSSVRETSFNKISTEQIDSARYSKSSISRKNDELLTASLKELVREARKELTPSQPIKMAVDIFSNTHSNTRCASDNEWEKDSNDDIKHN